MVKWTMIIAWLLLTNSIIEIAVKSYYFRHHPDDHLNALDIFHYFFVFMFYPSFFFKHWMSSSQIAAHHSMYSTLRKWFCPQYALPDMLRLRTHSPSTKPSAATQSTNTLDPSSNPPSNPSSNPSSNQSGNDCSHPSKGTNPLPDLQILDGITTLHPPHESATIFTETYFESMETSTTNLDGMKDSQYPRKSINHTLVSYTQYASESKLALSPLQTALNRVNSDGKLVGKRGAPKPRKLKDRRQKVAKSNQRLTIPTLNDAPFRTQMTELKLSGQKSDHRRKVTEFDEKHLGQTQHSMTNTEEWVDGVLHRMESTVNTVVFELDKVICTNIDALSTIETEPDLTTLTHLRKQLCFGGESRIESLKDFLWEIHKSNTTETLDQNIKCFIISKKSSRLILRLLKDVGLLSYFVSASPSNPKKLISHIIGADHIISKESEGRTHLILLQLMQSLDRSHDEMLYVGNDRNGVDHLKRIKICRTDWCETRGLTQNAMNEILERCCNHQQTRPLEPSMQNSMSPTMRDESTFL